MCGCGGSKIDWDEFERILREIETDDTPEVEPEAIPVENWPVRKPEEVEVNR